VLLTAVTIDEIR